MCGKVHSPLTYNDHGGRCADKTRMYARARARARLRCRARMDRASCDSARAAAGASSVLAPHVRKVVAATSKLFVQKKAVQSDEHRESPSILRITVLQAKNLPAKDDNGLSDPYLCLHYGDDNPVVRTEIRKMTLTPQWNQTLDFAVWKIPPEVSGLEEPRVTIRCWDWEESGFDQYMGAVDVDVESLVLDGDPIEGWFMLEDPAEPDAFGEVEVEVRWMTRPTTGPDAIISVNVMGAQELPPIGSHGFVDPFVKVMYSGDVVGGPQTTATRTRTMDPMWREILEFPARSGEVGVEHIDVYVYHKSTFKDKLVGWTQISLAGFNFEQDAVYYDLMPAEWDPNKKRVKGAEDEDDEDLGRIHLQIKCKKKRLVTTPDTTVRVTIMECKRLPPRMRQETCDPYVTVEFEKQVKKTQVRFKQAITSCPEYSETFVYEAWSDRLDSSLLISVMDQQEWKKDRVIGCIPINLLEYNVGDFYEEWKQLNCPEFPESQAEIKFQIAIRQKPEEKDCDSQLRVRVIEAKDLPALDWGGTSDPYVVASFENSTRRTGTIFKTLKPVWNELLVFNTKSGDMDNLLQLECFDADLGGKDDTAGRCEVDLTDLALNDTVKQWMPLRDLLHPNYQGQLLVEVTLVAKVAALTPDCNLMITVKGCKDLVAADVSGTSDPFVVIDFDNTRKKTGTRFKTLNPTFDESFDFPHHSSHIQELCRFEVMDYDLIGSNQSLGFVYLKMGDLKIDQQTSMKLPIRLREDDDPTGELDVIVTLKRRSEFTINLMPRSKSMDTMCGFEDEVTGMAKGPIMYEFERTKSLASSGLVLDCESTNPIQTRSDGETGFVDELMLIWKEEQENRRQFDLQYTAELRHDQVEHNQKRGRNAKGKCALCGEFFDVRHKAVQCQVDKYWYHSFSISTIASSDTSCYELHKEPLKNRLKRTKLREDEREDEMNRRIQWDRDHEREKAAKANKNRLKQAVMARDFSKFAKRTRQVDTGHNPPFAVQVVFDRVEYDEFTKNSKLRRKFLQQLREDIASVLNIQDSQVSTTSLDFDECAITVQISDHPEGKDRWTPEQLANRFVKMIVGQRRNHRMNSTQVLVSAIKLDLKGPVLSSVAKLLFDVGDVTVGENAKSERVGVSKPDQAGYLPCYFYICSDFDDMRPEREFLAKEIWPAVDQWCATARAQFVPVDLRYGVTRAECYHSNVVATHLDEIDRCFPFFACMLGESYGWIPDDYYRNYGQLDEPRFDWLKDMPDSLSLVHLEIIHAYFRKKMDGEGPGGGRDDDFCMFYFRDKSWMNDPTFITDNQMQFAKQAAERRAAEEAKEKEAAADREMEEMSGDLIDPMRQNADYVDLRIIEGIDLGYWLDQKRNRNKDEKKRNLRKGSKGSTENAKNTLKKIGAGGAFAAKVVVGGSVGLLALGLYKGVTGTAKFLKAKSGVGNMMNSLKGKGNDHKNALKKAKKGNDDDGGDVDALFEELMKEEQEKKDAEMRAEFEQEQANKANQEAQDSLAGRLFGVEVCIVLPMSMNEFNEHNVVVACKQELSKLSGAADVELNDVEGFKDNHKDRVKAEFWVPMPGPKEAREKKDHLMEQEGKAVLDALHKAVKALKLKKSYEINVKTTDITAKEGERVPGDEAPAGEDGDGEDEDEDEDDEDDESSDDDKDSDAVRREMQEGLDHHTVKMKQPTQQAHDQLVKDLKNYPKHLPAAGRVKCIVDVYRSKWWTPDRMLEYFHHLPDDLSRQQVLAGPSEMFKRCTDSTTGILNELLDTIQDKSIKDKARAKMEEWEETSGSRGAHKGAVEHAEEEESEKGSQGSARKDEAASEGQNEGEQITGAEPGVETTEGNGKAAGGETEPQKKAKPPPAHRRGTLVSRLKSTKDSFKYMPWTPMMADFEKNQPLLTVKGEFTRLNLRSYNMTEWEDGGKISETESLEVDLTWGQEAVLGDDWESPDKGAHCIQFTWNGLGWEPALREITLLFKNRDERDWFLKFMYHHVIAWPLYEKFPDGTERVYLDSLGKGFTEPIYEYVEPAGGYIVPNSPAADLNQSLDIQEEEGAPQKGEKDASGEVEVAAEVLPGGKPAESASAADAKADGSDAVAEEFAKPFERKDPPAMGPRNFTITVKVWSRLLSKWIKQDAMVFCMDVKEVCKSTGDWTEDVKVPEHFGALELWEEGSILAMRERHDDIMARVVPHAQSICDRPVNFYKWEGQAIALIADQHGFSKELIDYYTGEPVWNFKEEGAFDKWTAIMKESTKVSEDALKQGQEAFLQAQQDAKLAEKGGFVTKAEESPSDTAGSPFTTAHGHEKTATSNAKADEEEVGQEVDDMATQGKAEDVSAHNKLESDDRPPIESEPADASPVVEGGTQSNLTATEEEKGNASASIEAERLKENLTAEERLLLEETLEEEDDQEDGQTGTRSFHAKEKQSRHVTDSTAVSGGNFGTHSTTSEINDCTNISGSNMGAGGAEGNDLAPAPDDSSSFESQKAEVQEGSAEPETGGEDAGADMGKQTEDDQKARKGARKKKAEEEELAFFAALEGGELKPTVSDSSTPAAGEDTSLTGKADGKERPNSSASQRSRPRSQRSHESEPGPEEPKLYLVPYAAGKGEPPERLLELISDTDNNPIRLDDHDTYETLWSHEDKTVSQLMEMLKEAVEVSRDLFDKSLLKRNVIESQGVRYILIGSMRDYDNPDGTPIQLLDPDTEDVIWDHSMLDAVTTFDTLTKHARVVGTHCTALRLLMDYRGTKVEVVESSSGLQEQVIIEHQARFDLQYSSYPQEVKEVWNRDTTDDAEQVLSTIVGECNPCGRCVVKWFDEEPPPKPPAFTTLDFTLWQCECEGRDKLVFHWMGPNIKSSRPTYGTFLQEACRTTHMPADFIVKTATQEMRDEWFKKIRAATIWARAQAAVRDEWQELSAQFARSSAEGDEGGYVLASTFVKKTEDQLDAFREWLYLIVDYKRDMFGWTTKAKSKMNEFKKHIVDQINHATGLPEGRVRLLSVEKANQKKSWLSKDRDPTFYLTMAKKYKHGGIVVEFVIDPDIEALEKMEREGRPSTRFVTSKMAAEDIVNQTKDAQSALRTGGDIVKTAVHAELKFQDDSHDEMKGDPLWIEMQFGGQRAQTQVKGSHSANWNEVFRFYIDDPDDREKGVINIRVYTTRIFGGKQKLGSMKIAIGPLVSNTIAPVTLTPEENENGMLVCQVKITPSNPYVIPKRPGPYRKPILKELPNLGLKQRHLTDDIRAEARLFDLKTVLCIETNVFKDYPCWYNGVDALGRVQLEGLVELGDRMADDIFACLKGYGRLKSALERPMDTLTLERAQHSSWQKSLGFVCAGRYETLLKAQKYVVEGAPNNILVITGKPGTGKSNVMACIHKMFAGDDKHPGYRVVPNPHTKQLQLDPVNDHSKQQQQQRGHLWQKPEVISIFMGASNGNNTPRYLLYSLMSQLAEILRSCNMNLEKSEHKIKVDPADPSKLFPIPHEYNKLRLQLLTLCQNLDQFVPHKRIVILIDQIDDIEGMRFDWMPVDLPKSLRLIISCGKGGMIKKMATSTNSLKYDLVQLQPFPMLGRKEMVNHLLRQRHRDIDMIMMDELVVKDGACMPDYLYMAIQVLAGFKKEMRFALPLIQNLEITLETVSIQVLERIEDYCGRNLVKNCLGLISVSMYGLNEYELRMLLARDAVADIVSHRLREQDEGTKAQYPGTSRDDRQSKFEANDKGEFMRAEKHAMLPMSLWTILAQMLKPYLAPSHECQAPKFQFLLKGFEATVSRRYGLEAERERIDLHRKIAAYFRARADPELQFTWRSHDYRASQCLIFHTIGAHGWKRLTDILTDVGFVEFCVNLGQVHGLCNDLKHAISALDGPGSREGADMKKIHDLMQLSSFLGKNAQMLLDFPAMLIQVMANEPPESPVARLAKQRIQGGWEGRNWLKRQRKHKTQGEREEMNARTMRGHKGWIRALAVTLDSKYVVSGADDKTARFWSCDSGALVHLLTGHREAITAVDVSSNGLYMITSSMDASVKLWDIRSGIELANLYVGSAATCCQFNHDGSRILAGTQDSTLHLFDMRTFQELNVMKSHRLGIRSCIFSKDSTKILSGGSDGLCMLWDLRTFPQGKKVIEAPNGTFQGHSNGVRALAWNPRNANQAVSGSDDFNIIVWNLNQGSITRTLVGHSAPVLSLCFTPSGAYILSSSHDSSLIIWDPNLDEVLFRFWGHTGPVYCVVVSVDEYMAISAGADSTIRTWELRGLLREDPDEPHILSKEMSAALKDEKAFTKTTRDHIQYGDIYCLAFSPSGDVLLSGSQDSSYALRSIQDGEVIGEPRRGHAGPVRTCNWHPDGTRIMTASDDTIIKMWEAASGRLLRTFKGHEGPVCGCNFFPDGAQMLSVSSDHYIKLWDVETGKMMGKMPPHLGHLSAVRCCAVSQDNNIFCTGGDDNFVRVWDKRSNMLVRKLISHSEPILTVQFGVDGGTILSGGLDQSVRLWDMTGSLINVWETNTAAVTSVAFSPSGRHIITGSRDMSVALFSNLTLKEVGRWMCESACQCVAASCRNGGVIAAGDCAGTSYVLQSILAPASEWRHF